MKIKGSNLKFLGVYYILLCMFILCQDKEKISFEKIIIDRVKYNTARIDILTKTFTKFFIDYKNMDILKYAICKYLLPRYLYTNSLQLLLHQSVLNLKEKCPECRLTFYRTVRETPEDFQWVAKIFNFAEKFADYKLKIQALQTLLHEIELYAEDIMKIYLENNREKLIDYIILLEDQIISIFTESFLAWDNNKKECHIKYNENIFFDKCITEKKIPTVDKGNTNCGCDNRIPLKTKDYFNSITSYPLDAIFHLNVMYSSHYSKKVKDALNFYYTFRKYIESNFINTYNLLKSWIDENEKTIYQLCIQQCLDPSSPLKDCAQITDPQSCMEKKCIWCENLKKCTLREDYCTPFICKNKQDFLSSKIIALDNEECRKAEVDEHMSLSINTVKGPYLNCRMQVFSDDEILKLCKKFKAVYICSSIWIHRIGDTKYDTQIQDCFLYNICKCFDEEQIAGTGNNIELPTCEPLLPR